MSLAQNAPAAPFDIRAYLRGKPALIKQLAREVDRYPHAVLAWKQVPPKHLKTVSAITGIPAQVLRPDIWEAFQSAPVENTSAEAA